MTLGQLVNLEQEKLAGEYHKLLEEITEYMRILSDDKIILGIIREDLLELKRSTPIRGGPKSAARRSARSTWPT